MALYCLKGSQFYEVFSMYVTFHVAVSQRWDGPTLALNKWSEWVRETLCPLNFYSELRCFHFHIWAFDCVLQWLMSAVCFQHLHFSLTPRAHKVCSDHRWLCPHSGLPLPVTFLERGWPGPTAWVQGLTSVSHMKYQGQQSLLSGSSPVHDVRVLSQVKELQIKMPARGSYTLANTSLHR